MLLYRALQRASALHVQPRALVDDCSLQWLADERARVGELGVVVQEFFDSLKNLQMVVQPSKSGYVATTMILAKAFEPLAKKLGVIKKVAIRNLGHEMHGTNVGRHQERQRLKALKARKRKLMILRHAAGGRVARLLRTGLLPSAAHGARVSGMSDTGLRELRSIAGALVGGKTCLLPHRIPFPAGRREV